MSGVVLVRARQDKEMKHWELLQESWCQLIFVGIETDGRWGDEALTFVRPLTSAHVRDTLSVLCWSAFRA